MPRNRVNFKYLISLIDDVRSNTVDKIEIICFHLPTFKLFNLDHATFAALNMYRYYIGLLSEAMLQSPKNSAIKEVRIHHDFVSLLSSRIEPFFNAIGSLPNLEVIHIDYSSVRGDQQFPIYHLTAMLENVKQHCSVKSITLSHCKLYGVTQKDFEHFFAALISKCSCSLEEFDADWVRFSMNSVLNSAKLISTLSTLRVLQILRMQNTFFGNEEGQVFANGLRSGFKAIEELSLSWNPNFSQESNLAIASALHDRGSDPSLMAAPLKELDLEHINLNPVCGGAFTNLNLKSLRCLNLKGNHIGDQVCTALATSILSKWDLSSRLETLDLSDCDIGNPGCIALANVLENQNHTLEHLHLYDNNNISDIGYSALLSVVKKKNFVLKEIGIGDPDNPNFDYYNVSDPILGQLRYYLDLNMFQRNQFLSDDRYVTEIEYLENMIQCKPYNTECLTNELSVWYYWIRSKPETIIYLATNKKRKNDTKPPTTYDDCFYVEDTSRKRVKSTSCNDMVGGSSCATFRLLDILAKNPDLFKKV